MLVKDSWVFLCEGCLAPEDGQFYAGAVAAEGPCVRCGNLGVNVLSNECERPMRFKDSGWNNPVSSLALVPRVIWDVNGYYRLLGVPTDATRKQIMQRYMEINGSDDARITYAAKVLLGKRRDFYDSLALGTLYADPWVIASAQSRAASRDAQTVGIGDEYDDDGVSEMDRLSKMEGKAVVIDEQSDTLDEHSSDNRLLGRFGTSPWRRYRWRTSKNSRDSKLDDWRHAVALALWRRGIVMDFGVGIVGWTDDLVKVETVMNTPVAFLADHAQVTDEAANLAALRLAGSKSNGI